MTKVIPIAFFSTLILIAGFLTENNISHSYSTGAPAGYSNAPGENNCTSCHSGTLYSGTGVPSITTNIPASGYVGGETYTITAKIVQSGIARFGFEVSVENQSTSHIGSLIVTNSTETQIVSSNYITHKFGGTAGSGSRTWTFNWKAPCAGQDTAIFYGTFNATNSNNSDTGDKIYATKIKVGENLINSADSASQISMSDVNNNYNGSDLRVQFKKPGCESRTSTGSWWSRPLFLPVLIRLLQPLSHRATIPLSQQVVPVRQRRSPFLQRPRTWMETPSGITWPTRSSS